MKTAAIIFFLILAIIVPIWLTSRYDREQSTTQQFMYINKRIDSLKAIILVLSTNQDTIKSDLDTLKQGQKIIFDEVKKSEKSFWNLF